MDTIFWLSPSIESCNWIDLLSVANASWYHWNCGRTQRKAAAFNQFACPSYSLYVQLLWYPMYYPGGMKARVSPVQWSKPHSILAPTQDSNPGGRIQNHKQWPLRYHCTHADMKSLYYAVENFGAYAVCYPKICFKMLYFELQDICWPARWGRMSNNCVQKIK